MRKLFLLRGLPGSGKSTWIRDNGFDPYTLSSDKLREMFAGLEYNIEGNLCISARKDNLVWETLNSMLITRMSRGLTTFIDATNIKEKTINKYKKMADIYAYKVYVIDFTDVLPETCFLRNKARGYKRVPDSVINSMADALKNSRVPKDVTVLKPDEVLSLLQGRTVDATKYSGITFIGDVHGCLDDLKMVFENGIDENILYVFTGDYIDRGPKSVETVLYLSKLSKFDNFIFLEGNHERWLRDWLTGILQDIRSKDFLNNTMKQFDKYFKVKKGEDFYSLCKFIKSLKEYVVIKYVDRSGTEKNILACHGGIPTFPNKYIELTPSDNFIRGVGSYEDTDEVDCNFAYNTEENLILVHGHRNVNNTPIKVNRRVYNLEGAVERGGCLRTVSFYY